MLNLNKLEHIAQSLEECEALIVDDPIDLYYLTGLSVSQGRLILQKKTPPLFLLDGRYEQMARRQSSLEIKLWNGKEPLPAHLPHTVGFDALTTSYAAYELLCKNSTIKWVSLQGPILNYRQFKEIDEIQKIKEAADLCAKGYQHVLSILKENISEEEIALHLEIFWKKLGGKKVSFDPIIAFGDNSANPHHRAGTRRLKKGDAVLIDIGVELNHYQSDMTRVVFCNTVSAKMKEVYHLVYEASKHAYALCKAGVILSKIDAAARDFIEQSGYSFVHSLGHGVGLQVHEWPRVKQGEDSTVLEPGMVITIEPGIYLPGVGGVRLEELICITSDGYTYLSSPAISPTPIVIEI